VTFPLNLPSLVVPPIIPLAVANEDLGTGLTALGKKVEENTRAASYYEGSVPEAFTSARLRRAMSRSGVKFVFNFANTPVDALTDRLEIAAVKTNSTNVTQLLVELWKVNKLDLEAPNIHRRAGEFGDAYVMVWPRDDMPPIPEDGDDPASLGPDDVGIYYNSSDTVRLFYRTENPLKKSHAIKRWQLEGKRWRVDLLYPHWIERYISKPDTKGANVEDYERYIIDFEYDELTGEQYPIWPVENPYGEVPVFHFRNDRPYGQPEHKGFYGPQDAINKLIISHMAGVDYQSFPQRYALLEADKDSSEAADVDEDEFTFRIDGEDGTSTTGTRDGEGRSQFSSDPGSLWYMTGVKGVGQFEIADPDVFLKPMERYLRFGAQICTTPLRMFDYERAQLPSGQSQSQADGPFVKKVRNRQLSYGGEWQDLFTFALRIMGIEDMEVMVLWAPPQTVDDADGWQTIGLKLAAGVPFEQVMREAGYQEDEIKTWPKPSKNPPADDNPGREE